MINQLQRRFMAHLDQSALRINLLSVIERIAFYDLLNENSASAIALLVVSTPRS